MAGKDVNEPKLLSSIPIDCRLRPDLHEFDDIAVGIGDKGDPIVRPPFAHGALAAARWVAGKKGWFTMRDVLGLE